QDDVFCYLRTARDHLDVVMCLGFFYHTYRHPELLALIRRQQPRYLIMDSQVIRRDGLLCAVRKDRVLVEFEAAEDSTSYGGATFVATPTAALLKEMIAHYDFRVREVDWPSLLHGDVTGAQDYAEGRRITLICEAVESPD